MLLLTACAADSGADSGKTGRVIASCDLLPTGQAANCSVTSATNQALIAPAIARLEKSPHRVVMRDGQPIPNQRHSYTVTFGGDADGHTSDLFHFSVSCVAGAQAPVCSTKAEQVEDQPVADHVSRMIETLVSHWPELVAGSRVFDVDARTSTGIQVIDQTPVLFAGKVIVSKEWACPSAPSTLFSDRCIPVSGKTLVPAGGGEVPLDYRYEAVIIGVEGVDPAELRKTPPRSATSAGVVAPQG